MAALKKGGIRAHICTMSYIVSYPRECRKGRSKVMQTVPYKSSLKLSKTYVKY